MKRSSLAIAAALMALGSAVAAAPSLTTDPPTAAIAEVAPQHVIVLVAADPGYPAPDVIAESDVPDVASIETAIAPPSAVDSKETLAGHITTALEPMITAKTADVGGVPPADIVAAAEKTVGVIDLDLASLTTEGGPQPTWLTTPTQRWVTITQRQLISAAA